MAENTTHTLYPMIKTDVAGIDIGAGSHFVAVPEDRKGPHVKEFQAETHGLVEMAKFLAKNRIKQVALEATGIFWIPVYNHLEGAGFEVFLLNPRSLQGIPGKKTDVKDCQWIRDLFSHGFGQPSFVPAKEFVSLREFVRLRMRLVRDNARNVQHMIKSLRLMNITLERAVSDVTGVTGLAIIDAILGGERDPLVLASLRDKRCRKSEVEIAACLDGVYTEHHLTQLGIARDFYRLTNQKISQLDDKIMAELGSIKETAATDDESTGGDPTADESNDGGKRVASSEKDRVTQALLGVTANAVDLTKIEGIGTGVALIILAEIGSDMSRWPTVKHFTSWLGLCPGSKISGGKVLSSATRKVSSRAAWAFRMAANSVRKSKSYLGAFFRKMLCRQGPQKAITTTAHKLARLVFSLLKHGHEYVAQKTEEMEKNRTLKKMLQVGAEAAKLGMKVEYPSDQEANKLLQLKQRQVADDQAKRVAAKPGLAI
jgi:transposase